MKKFFIWTVFDQILVSGGNFLTIFLGAIYLSLHDQGNLIILLSFYFFCLIASIALVYAPTQSLYPKFDNNSNYIFTGFLYHILISIALILLVVVSVHSMNLSDEVHISNNFLQSFLIFVFLQQIADYGRRVSYVIYSSFVSFCLSAMLYLPRIIGLLIVEPNNLNDFLMVLIFANVIDGILVVVFIVSKKIKDALVFEKYMLKQHVLFSRNIFYSAPIGWSVAYLPTLVLGFFSGPFLVGVLGTLRGIVGVANLFVEMIEVSAISHLASKNHKGEQAYVKLFFQRLIVGFTISWLIVFFLIYNFYRYGAEFVAPEFHEYQSIFLMLCLVYFIYFYGRMHVLYLRVFFNTKAEFYNSKVALVSTLLSFPLIYVFDIIGAASVLIVAQLFALFFTFKRYGLNVTA